MPHESFEVQTVDYCKWELFQGGLWVIICSALQGAVLGPRGQRFHGRGKRRQSNTCWATDSQHETSQQACLLFLMSVIYMKEPPSPNRNSVLYAAVWLTGFHILRVTPRSPHPPLPRRRRSLPEQLDDDCCIIAQNMLPVELVWNVAPLCWARDGRWHLLSVILRNRSH